MINVRCKYMSDDMLDRVVDIGRSNYGIDEFAFKKPYDRDLIFQEEEFEEAYMFIGKDFYIHYIISPVWKLIYIVDSSLPKDIFNKEGGLREDIRGTFSAVLALNIDLGPDYSLEMDIVDPSMTLLYQKFLAAGLVHQTHSDLENQVNSSKSVIDSVKVNFEITEDFVLDVRGPNR